MGPFTADFMAWRSPPTCGDDIVDPGEQCDNGAYAPGDCCDPGCRVVTKGTRCGAAVPNFCSDPRTCDGAGACVTPSCKAPAVAGAARLAVNTRAGTLRWKWVKGQATALAAFGDPVHTDEYTLCLVDESGATPSTLFPDVILPGTSWRTRAERGFTYRNTLGMGSYGVTRATLKPGAEGTAKIAVSTYDGPNLPALPLALPFTVQLYGHGECWGATYVEGGVKKNTATSFVAKSSPQRGLTAAAKSAPPPP